MSTIKENKYFSSAQDLRNNVKINISEGDVVKIDLWRIS